MRRAPIGALALAAFLSTPALAATVDGQLEPVYGSPTGAVPDAAYVFAANNTLYLFVAGTLSEDWRGPELNTVHFDLSLLIDTGAGGQNVLRSDNPSVGDLGVLAGLKFDSDFTPGYWI